MIHRIYGWMILAIVLPDVYIWLHYYRRRFPEGIHLLLPACVNRLLLKLKSQATILKILWWLPCFVMVVYTLALASIHNFAPTDLTWLNLYLLLFGLFVGPKAIFALTSFIGSGIRRLFHTRYNYGHRAGLLLGTLAVMVYVYGLTIGIGRIKTDHVDLYFKDLPKEFDGFRIIHISDLHVGTFDGWRKFILEEEIDSIRSLNSEFIIHNSKLSGNNSQFIIHNSKLSGQNEASGNHKPQTSNLKPQSKDLKPQNTIVCFTGDLQNMRPEEVEKMMPVLKRLPYTYFILGNHDYAQYVRNTPGLEQRMRKKLLSLESQLGKPLCNQNIKLTRGGSSIYLAGEENDGKPPFPSRGNLKKTLAGIPDSAFVILLQHDPSAWHRDILPHSHVQLTLSGHTHGGQMQILGWRPTHIAQKCDLGLYSEHGRYLYVSAGLGGLVPFRLNMPNEITVITLHTKR